MVNTCTKFSDLEIEPENLIATESDIKSLKDPNLLETNIQGIIVSGIKNRFCDYKNLVSEVEIKNLHTKRGKDDSWIRVVLTNGVTINIGIEVKRTNTTYKGIKSFDDLSNFGSVQQLDYINGSYETAINTKFDIVLIATDKYLDYLYLSKNKDAYYEMIDVLDEIDCPPSKLWDSNRKKLEPICNKFIWEPRIYIDAGFTYASVVDKVITDLKSKIWSLQ